MEFPKEGSASRSRSCSGVRLADILLDTFSVPCWISHKVSIFSSSPSRDSASTPTIGPPFLLQRLGSVRRAYRTGAREAQLPDLPSLAHCDAPGSRLLNRSSVLSPLDHLHRKVIDSFHSRLLDFWQRILLTTTIFANHDTRVANCPIVASSNDIGSCAPRAVASGLHFSI